VVGVHDGDTLTGITASNEQVKVRLDAIDAPEIKQPYGQAAKKALSDMFFGKEVVIYPKTKDKVSAHHNHPCMP
jgi:micrococcal nuclease